MAEKCIPILETGTQEQANELNRVATKWFNNPAVQVQTGGKHSYFKTFYNTVLPHLDHDLSRLPNKKELKKLEQKMDKYLLSVGNTPGKLGEWFKLPENILGKHPVTKRFFEQLVLASNYYRGNLETITSDLNLIKKNLNIASGHVSIMNKWGYGRSKAQAKYKSLEAQWKKLNNNGDKEAADRFYDEHLHDLSKDTDLAVLQNLHELMSNPNLLSNQNIRGTRLKYGGELVEAANVWHKGVAGGKPLKDRLWTILGAGLKDNIEMLENMKSDYSEVNFQLEKLRSLYTDYFDPKNPNSKKEKNYFPRQVLDIAPTFAKLSDDIHSGHIERNPKEVGKYIDRMVTDVKSYLKVPGNVFERGIDDPVRVSKDVLDILDTYSHNAIRFNYNARVSKNTFQALKELYNQEGTAFDENLAFLSGYVKDTHEAALGLKFRNNKLGTIARAITSWQFISKLGFNVRTVGRNATQSLQNWVYFGGKAIYEAMNDQSSDRMKQILNQEMKRHGYEFVNIQEFAMPRELMSNLKTDETGKVIEIAPNVGSKFNDWLENIARISGKPMQWVENNVNRGLTFKLAFLNKYNELTGPSGDALVRRAIKANPKKYGDKEYGANITEKIENAKIRQASRYGAEIVKELHYLYDPWAKPKITRSPLGSVLGQFTTYGINFFEYQRKIAASGLNEVMRNAWNSPEAWRMYRLGMLYTMVTGLGAVTNAKWSNLVQNDTWDRLSRLDQYLRGDKEEKKQAFFGRDPITATFGGPFVSDVIKIGSLINFSKMNGTDMSSYLHNYKVFSERAKHPATEELVRTLNTQLGRLIYTTGPNMINGTGFPTLVGQELGLYNTPELNKLKGKILYPLQKYLPKRASKYFTPQDQTKAKPEGSKYSMDEIESILRVLDNLNTPKPL